MILNIHQHGRSTSASGVTWGLGTKLHQQLNTHFSWTLVGHTSICSLWDCPNSPQPGCAGSSPPLGYWLGVGEASIEQSLFHRHGHALWLGLHSPQREPFPSSIKELSLCLASVITALGIDAAYDGKGTASKKYDHIYPSERAHHAENLAGFMAPIVWSWSK